MAPSHSDTSSAGNVSAHDPSPGTSANTLLSEQGYTTSATRQQVQSAEESADTYPYSVFVTPLQDPGFSGSSASEDLQRYLETAQEVQRSIRDDMACNDTPDPDTFEPRAYPLETDLGEAWVQFEIARVSGDEVVTDGWYEVGPPGPAALFRCRRIPPIRREVTSVADGSPESSRQESVHTAVDSTFDLTFPRERLHGAWLQIRQRRAAAQA